MKPMPMNLTLDEQERWAYAEGNAELAAALARADDAERAVLALEEDLARLSEIAPG